MANRQKYPALQLRGKNYEVAESRELGERIRINGIIDTDYSCFKKSAKEKEVLKLAKLNCRLNEMRR